MIASLIGVTPKLLCIWINNGEAIQRQLEEHDINSIDDITDEYDKLCFQYYLRTREAKAKLTASLTTKYIKLGEITQVDHVKEKILYKSLISLDREKWTESPQVQINQQFNNFNESDKVLNTSIMYGHIQGAVNAALPEASIDAKRALIEKLKRSLSAGSREMTPAIVAENAEISA